MEELKKYVSWRNPLPWSVKEFADHEYNLYFLFDADGELVDLHDEKTLEFISKCCNEKSTQ